MFCNLMTSIVEMIEEARTFDGRGRKNFAHIPTKIDVATESQNRFEKNGHRSHAVCRSKLESEVSKYALRFRFIWRDCESFSARQTR